jgi:hypothetical protein
MLVHFQELRVGSRSTLEALEQEEVKGQAAWPQKQKSRMQRPWLCRGRRDEVLCRGPWVALLKVQERSCQQVVFVDDPHHVSKAQAPLVQYRKWFEQLVSLW